MKYLDLSKNQVFGSVPQSVVGLEKLNLSYNRLCGKIPASKFPAAAFAESTVFVNDVLDICLCGADRSVHSKANQSGARGAMAPLTLPLAPSLPKYA
ncbi:hypothetical protein Syun_005787 [Stephania yunnanensis]|uniref:Uncharacterized protein n=1 Tax=Stephania yunnanensis TaxID=152371 RepID=A0AAP0Q0Q9_9MAGN